MPFQPNNELWKLSLKARADSKEVIREFIERIGVNGLKQYFEFVGKLAKSEKLTKEQRLFMNKVENLFEYLMPKLSRTVLAGDKDNPIMIQPVLVEFMNDKKNNKNSRRV
jgi:hypothetical protein